MSYLTNDQVLALNEKHGWFKFRDAQSDVSRAFAQDAIAMHERIRGAAPELLAACENARDMIATDRQSFVDCQRLRDGRTENPIAHGLVAVGDGAWITPEDAEALCDYDRALSLIDAAVTKATGESA